jgi:hypothetical protein
MWKQKLRLFLMAFNIFISVVILLSFVSVAINMRAKAMSLSSTGYLNKQIFIEGDNPNYPATNFIDDKSVSDYRAIYLSKLHPVSDSINSYPITNVHSFYSSQGILLENEIAQMGLYDHQYLLDGRVDVNPGEVLVSANYLQTNALDNILNQDILFDSGKEQITLKVVGIINFDVYGFSDIDFIFNNSDLPQQQIVYTTIEVGSYEDVSRIIKTLQTYRYNYTANYEFIKQLYMMVNILVVGLYLIGSLLAFVALISLYSSVSASIEEKEKLICLLHTLGLKKKEINKIFLMEILFVGAICFALAFFSLLTTNAILIKTLNIEFLNTQFNNILAPNLLAIGSSFIIIMGLLSLIYLRPIKKMAIKLPGEIL